MSSEDTNFEDTSSTPPSTEDEVPTGRLFLLGYVPKARHNSSLKAIASDLLSHYYVSINSSKWTDSDGQPSRSRTLLTNADVMLFFINEQTLRDSNCLLNLQYAWYSMLPVIMLRPPMTQLVISNRDSGRMKETVVKTSNGSITRSSSVEPWELLRGLDKIDYSLLQDILDEGYKISTIYDSTEHSKSMSRVRRRLVSFFENSPNLKSDASSCTSQPHFYLSPSNHSSFCKSPNDEVFIKERSSSSSRRRNQKTRSDKDNSQSLLSLSTGNLNKRIHTPYPQKHLKFDYDDDSAEDRSRSVLKSPPPPERIPSSVGFSDNPDIDEIIPDNPTTNVDKSDDDQFPYPPPTPLQPHETKPRPQLHSLNSTTSQTSSLDRRMSLSCLEDVATYQRTQYIVFPMNHSSKIPYVVKFPEDLQEEEEKCCKSVWGSETSLDFDVNIADTISAGLVVKDDDEDEDDHQLRSPAPYLDSLT